MPNDTTTSGKNKDMSLSGGGVSRVPANLFIIFAPLEGWRQEPSRPGHRCSTPGSRVRASQATLPALLSHKACLTSFGLRHAGRRNYAQFPLQRMAGGPAAGLR